MVIQYFVISSTGEHQFMHKDQALAFIQRLNEFEGEGYAYVESYNNSDRYLIQRHDSLIPRIYGKNNINWAGLVDQYRKVI